MKRRQTISAYLDEHFEPDSQPAHRTIVRAIQKKEIDGEFYLGRWWVLRDRAAEATGQPPPTSTGNERADKILASVG